MTDPTNPFAPRETPGWVHCCRKCWNSWAKKQEGIIYPPFIVCPSCGNKRCPKATDHALTCTGSNEPGQKGSAYE